LKKKNYIEKINPKKKSFNDYKTWCSENNLSILTNNFINDFQTSYDTERFEADIKNNEFFDLESFLKFSDHGIFDEPNNSILINSDEKNSIDKIDMDIKSKIDLNYHYLPNNNDIYKLTFSKNFNFNKLKNKNQENQNNFQSLSKYSEKNIINDSLTSLLKQKNDIKSAKNLINENNRNQKDYKHNEGDIDQNGDDDDNDEDDDDDDDDYDDYDDYDEDDDYDDDFNKCNSSNKFTKDINLRSEVFKKINEHEFFRHLNNSLTNQKTIDNLEESMINWSMKLSNYQTSHKRSHSRSPLSRSNSSSQMNINKKENDCTHNYKTNNQDNQIGFRNILINDNIKKNKKQERHQKTSWGKLKNSKSSYSNISNSINNSNDENIDLNQSLTINNSNFDYSYNSCKNSIYKFENNEKNKDIICKLDVDSKLCNLPSTSTPSLFKLFQDSKAYLNTVSNDDHKLNRKSENRFDSKIKLKEDNFEKNSKLRTTSFSQLRERSQSSHAVINYSIKSKKDNLSENIYLNQNNNKISKKSIGVQHQHRLIMKKPTIVCMLVECNHKTTTKEIMAAAKAARVAVAKRSTSLFSTKSSLPDLTFLKEYSDEKNKNIMNSFHNNQPEETELPNMTQSSDISVLRTNQLNSNGIIGSDLLKRKTLKSIKRYRQTKQNTEPCLLDKDYQTSLYNQCINGEQNRVFLKLNNHNYFTHDKYILENQYVLNGNLNSNNSKKEKRPLKSCLKRKESQPIDFKIKLNNNSNDSNIFDFINEEFQNNLNSQSVMMNVRPLRLYNKYDSSEDKKNVSQKMTVMFVPSIGYLFTCDHESITRYRYYNALEHKRRLKNFYQLTNSNLNEKQNNNLVKSYTIEKNNDKDCIDNCELDCDKTDSNILINRKSYLYYNGKSFNESKSENDLRAKKSVTFLSNAVDYVSQKQNSLLPTSRSERIFLLNNNSNNNNRDEIKAPLLQYNNLIALLNTNPLDKNLINQTEIYNEKKVENSQEIVSCLNQKNIDRNLYLSYKDYQENSLDQNNLSSIKQNNSIKNLQIIDTDSISLASLSESPPSEFKFSDEEDNLNHFSSKSFNSNKQHQKLKNFEIMEIKDVIPHNKMFRDGEKKYEHEKYLRIQQIKMNQTKRKNFQASILNDSKCKILTN
jgi:hypothetical protein